ncbi:ATP-binding cassette domain-containing protein [Xanthobacter autotrophicus DSM 431]|uniref:ATP-binding cassette domain-containing protein n=1 Tax=Xanthobacter nonsaccharivorans TaxID=3119912 RepID=UPI0037274319
MLLDVKNSCASIDGVTVLRSVSMGLDAGETVALIGRNGAGKASLLRAVMGLLALDSGEVAFAGETLSALPAHLRVGRGIGYAPEDRRLVGKFSVLENILVPASALSLTTRAPWTCVAPSSTSSGQR